MAWSCALRVEQWICTRPATFRACRAERGYDAARMSAGSPYRSESRGDLPQLVLYPMLLLRLSGLALVVVIATTALFLVLWSRVVTITCASPAPRALRCVAREEALVGSGVLRTDLDDALHVRFAGDSRLTRGDAWIEARTAKGTVALTNGFNGSKAGQRAAAAAIDRLLDRRDGHDTSVTVSYGARWVFAWVPGLAYAMALLVIVGLGLRVTVTIDRGRLVVDRRRPLLRSSKEAIELGAIAAFVHSTDRGGRGVVAASLRSGEVVPLFHAIGPLAPKALARLEAFVREARER